MWVRQDQCSPDDVDLSAAYFDGARSNGANLSGTNRSGADLSNTDLTGANLKGASLLNADLSGAHLIEAELAGSTSARGTNTLVQPEPSFPGRIEAEWRSC